MVFLWPSPRRHMVSLPSKNFRLSESRFPWEIQENTDPTYQWEKLPRMGRGQFLTCHIFLFSTLKSNNLTTVSVCWNCLEAFCNQVRTFFQSQLLKVWPSQSQKIRFLISSQLEVNSSCFKKGCVYSLNGGFKFFPLRLFFSRNLRRWKLCLVTLYVLHTFTTCTFIKRIRMKLRTTLWISLMSLMPASYNAIDRTKTWKTFPNFNNSVSTIKLHIPCNTCQYFFVFLSATMRFEDFIF